MKTRLFSVIVVMLVSVLTISAKPKNVSSQSEAGQVIAKEISYPALARELNIEGTVYMKIKADSEGNFKYAEVYATDDVLKKSVTKQLKKIEPQLAKVLRRDEEKVFKIKFESVK